MATIAIRDVPNTATSPSGTEFILIDNGVEMQKAVLDNAVAPKATAAAAAAIASLDLGTASQADTDDFATAAQGAKADSAVQPGSLATVATTGAYADLTGKPTLGTAAAQNSTAFATAAQGATADSAIQPGDLSAVATSGDYDDLTNLPTLGALASKSKVSVSDVEAGGTPSNTTYLRGDGAWATPAGGGGGGGGDMEASIYDPTSVANDAFNRTYHHGSQLASTISDFSTAADARVSAAIGSTVQGYDADLASWASVTRASGFDTFAATPTSANLAALVTNETGTGSLVFATSPTLVTPALGTPSSATLTNATGLPISTGVSGLGSGVAALLATFSSANLRAALTDEVGTGAAYFVGGALGTPASATLTNATGLPVSGITSSTATALGVGSLEVGHASDTTISRVSSGVIAVEGNTVATLTQEDQTVSGGARITLKDLGNLSGASITPDPGDRPTQKVTNNGAGSILPGSNYGSYRLLIVNTTGAGAITTTGWVLKGDSFDTTTTSKFLCGCDVYSDMSVMTIVKVA